MRYSTSKISFSVIGAAVEVGGAYFRHVYPGGGEGGYLALPQVVGLGCPGYFAAREFVGRVVPQFVQGGEGRIGCDGLFHGHPVALVDTEGYLAALVAVVEIGVEGDGRPRCAGCRPQRGSSGKSRPGGSGDRCA